MPVTLELLDRKPITFDSASRNEDNMLNKLSYVPETKNLYLYFWQQRHTLEALTTHHLGLRNSINRKTGIGPCVVQGPKTWIRGAFNVCIPVEVTTKSLFRAPVTRKVLMRCPMPFKLAEPRYPGTVDEKLGSEVATYAWMQEHCPDIRIPKLYGFGFTDGRHFTHIQQRSWIIRFFHALWRRFRVWMGRPVPSLYRNHAWAKESVGTGYMLLEYIDQETGGQMLSATWQKHRDDPARVQNLYRAMSRVMLSLARIPQPCIGSFRFQPDGSIALANRPLICSHVILENDGAPRTVKPDETYNCTTALVSDLLSLYDRNFVAQPNAVHDDEDARMQMAVMTLLRTVSHHFLKRDRRKGPFVLQFSDFNPSNIFVDDDWNITCLIDLEWVSSLPVDMLAAPYWLTGRAIDQVTKHMDEFAQAHRDFTHVVAAEEQELGGLPFKWSIAKIMQENLDSRAVWFYHCVTSVNAMYSLVEDHICPKFSADLTTKSEAFLSQFWSERSEKIVQRKLADKKRYDQDLKQAFAEKSGKDGKSKSKSHK